MKKLFFFFTVLGGFVLLLLLCGGSAYAQQPVISSLSAVNGYPGSTLTISGSGFNTTPDSNIVWFGATQAAVTAATSGSLSVDVPVGATYMPVTVTNTASHLTGYSDYPFLPYFNNSAYVPGTTHFDVPVNFTDTPNYSNYYWTSQMAIVDIDGDGKPDMVTIGISGISVYLNTSTSGSITSSSFALPIDLPLTTEDFAWYQVFAIGDIDGDGKPDLVRRSSVNDSIVIYRNTSFIGGVSFAPPVSFAGNYAQAIVIRDIDGDGKADIVTDNGATISVFRNTATAGNITAASLAAPVNFATGVSSPASGMAIGDIDGDGGADVAVTDGNDSLVWVLRNTSTVGTPSFAPSVSFQVGSSPSTGEGARIAISDIDGDGKPDLVVTNSCYLVSAYYHSTISVLYNRAITGTINGSTFATQVVFPLPGSIYWVNDIAVGDFDGDGKPDIALIVFDNYIGGDLPSVFTLRNTSTAGVIDSNSLATNGDLLICSNSFTGIVAGDLDGDKKADIVGVNGYGNVISVLRNNPLYPPPTITSVNPAIDSPGTTVTITGTYFNNTAANDIVYFGATQAAVTAASDTMLRVTVPVGATYAPVTVNNTLHGLTAYSPKSFLPDYNNSPYIPGTINFDPQVTFSDPLDSDLSQVVVADIDGDGKADMVVIGRNMISVYLNTSVSGSITTGSFAAPVDISLPVPAFGESFMIAAGDIDGDGKPDLVTAHSVDIADDGEILVVYHNTSSIGTVSFEPPVQFATYFGGVGIAESIIIRDIDGDGKADVLMNTPDDIIVFQNDASVGSITATSLASPPAVVENPLIYTPGFAISDLDGDGKPDLVVTGAYNVDDGNTAIGVFHNISTPGSFFNVFAPPVYFYYIDRVNYSDQFGLIICDIDGDGKPDLAVNFGDSLYIFHNTSTGGVINSSSFAPPVVFITGSNSFQIASGDFNGDGKPDLAVTSGADTVSVFLNTATPGVIDSNSLAVPIRFLTGSMPGYVVAADIDGDKKADMVVVNQHDNTVSVLRNDPHVASGITSPSLANGSVALFPNPATNELTIKINTGSYTSFTITNTIGQQMIQQQLTLAQTKVNIAALPTGLYYVTLRGDSGVKALKFEKM